MRTPLLSAVSGAGQFLGPAFACGLNLYLTVALIGLASRFGWTDAVPLGLRGLEHPLVIASALSLYLVEFAVDKVRYLDSAWDAVHTLIRPPAAALLGVLALQDVDPVWQAAGGLAAGAAALAAHALKAGLRMRLHASPRRWPALLASVVEDVLAAALVLAALLRIPAAAWLSLTMALAVVLLGPRLVLPATLGIRLLHARARSIFRGRKWRGRSDLPTSLRQLVPEPAIGEAEPRAARAALVRGGVGAARYRTGWLVIDATGAAFYYRRRLLGSRRQELPRPFAATVRTGLLADALDVNAGTMVLLLPKDGPEPRLAAAELARSLPEV